MAAALGAARERVALEQAVLAGWRDRLESEIARIAGGAAFFGAGHARLANTSCFAVPGIEAQVLLMSLDMEGVSASSGSACSSGTVRRSHVLTAMGVAPDLARGAIRISLGWNSSEDDCALFLEALDKSLRTIRGRTPRAAGRAA